MRNLLEELPKEYEQLHGRCRFCCDFVAPEHVRERDVLDIGCGFGWFERFAARLKPRRLIGIEPRDADLAAARSIAAETGAEFLCAGAFQLPCAAASIDTVCLWDVIEHVPRRSEPALFAEIARALRPGGVVYLSTPFASVRAAAFDPAFWLIGHRHYTVARLAALAAPAGLRLTAGTVRGRWFELAGILNLYFSKWVLRRQPLCEAWFSRGEDADLCREEYMTVYVRFEKT